MYFGTVDKIAIFIMSISLLLVTYFVGATIEQRTNLNKLRKEGRIEYYLDENDIRQWRWKE
jgi:hypothetical protein